jgi:cobalt-zinc-cadmium efflux system outer membrane protein
MYRTCASISLLVLTTGVAAQQPTLTEAMAVQFGLTRDAVQQRVEGKLAEAHSDVLSARKRPNPEFSYERETLDNDQDAVEQKITVSQQFDFSGRRSLHSRAAERHLEAARLEAGAWRADLTRDIRERYYRALLQQERRRVYEAVQKRIAILSQALQKRRREGDVSLYDYQKVTTEHATIEAEVDNSRLDFDTSWQTLWATIGDNPGGFRSLQGQLLPAQPPPLEQLSVALDQQPALRQLMESSDAFALQQRAAGKRFPDITLGLGLKREETDNHSDNGLILHASVPIPVFDTGTDTQSRYRAQSLVARSEYEMAHATAAAELKGLWHQVAHYRRAAERFRHNAVASARDLMDTAETYYRAGEVGILELLDAYRGLLDAELTALELEHKARSAHIKLDHLTGASTQ